MRLARWLFLPLALTSCASGVKIKTWLITPDGLKHKSGGIEERQAFSDSQGYRCYSPSDDQLWRELLAAYKVGAEGCQ